MDVVQELIPVREKNECCREHDGPQMSPKGIRGDICVEIRGQEEPGLQKSRNSVLLEGSSKGQRLGSRNKFGQRGSAEGVRVSGESWEVTRAGPNLDCKHVLVVSWVTAAPSHSA